MGKCKALTGFPLKGLSWMLVQVVPSILLLRLICSWHFLLIISSTKNCYVA